MTKPIRIARAAVVAVLSVFAIGGCSPYDHTLRVADAKDLQFSFREDESSPAFEVLADGRDLVVRRGGRVIRLLDAATWGAVWLGYGEGRIDIKFLDAERSFAWAGFKVVYALRKHAVVTLGAYALAPNGEMVESP